MVSKSSDKPLLVTRDIETCSEQGLSIRNHSRGGREQQSTREYLRSIGSGARKGSQVPNSPPTSSGSTVATGIRKSAHLLSLQTHHCCSAEASRKPTAARLSVVSYLSENLDNPCKPTECEAQSTRHELLKGL
jgi:hypothetical protein